MLVMERLELVEKLREKVESGGNIRASAEQIVRNTQFSSQTLVRSYYAVYPPSEIHKNSRLTPDQEKDLYVAIQALSLANMDLTVKQIQDLVMSMFGVTVSIPTIYRFQKKHSATLSLKKTTSLGKKRQGPGIYNEVLSFVNQASEFFKSNQFASEGFVNYDESRIVLSAEGKMQIKRFVSKSKSKPQHKSKVVSKHCGTYLPFVSASGKLLRSYFVFPAKFDENGIGSVSFTIPKTFHATRSTLTPAKVFWNDTGYLNEHVWKKILKDFTSWWTDTHPGLKCCLIGDNVPVHRTMKAMTRAFKNGVYLLFFVSNTTHWSQPLDCLLFARLKQEISHTTQNLAFLQALTQENVFSFMDIVCQSASTAFSSLAITSSFKGTGIYPFSPEKILELARLNHGDESSVYEVTDPVDVIVERVNQGVIGFLKGKQESAMKILKQNSKVESVILKGKGYDVLTLMKQYQAQKEFEERQKKEKEEAKKQAQIDREKKKEQQLAEKEDRKRKREEKAREREEVLEAKKKRRQQNTCQENCGKTCRVGTNWVGCSFCDNYWVCPSCYSQRSVKTRLKQHEKQCPSKN